MTTLVKICTLPIKETYVMLVGV